MLISKRNTVALTCYHFDLSRPIKH
uniref:Uncharacterized protein n=1 Tax=Arundo donax TaxID=35708 RepID=A0A0A8YSY2_ARUDO